MWLLSQFKAPFSTLMGRNMFGDPCVVHPVVAGAVLLGRSRRLDHVLLPVAGDRRRRDPGVPVRPQTSRIRVVRPRRRGDVPAPPRRRLDQPRELPSRRIPRGVHRLRHLRRTRVEMAAVRRVRRAVVAREGGRVARPRATRDLGRGQARPADRADHHRREHRVHARGDVPRDAQPDRCADPQRLAHPVRRPTLG